MDDLFQRLFQDYKPPEKDLIGKLSSLWGDYVNWTEGGDDPLTRKGVEAFNKYSGLGGLGITKVKDVTFPKWFDDAIAEARRYEYGPKSRSTLVSMTPSDFLKMAEPLQYPDPGKMDRVVDIIRQGKQFTLPQLDFYGGNDLDKIAEVLGHEGRHRAMAMRNLGFDNFPVLLRSQGNPTIRWGEFKGQYPEWLRGQEENFINLMRFPKSLWDY